MRRFIVLIGIPAIWRLLRRLRFLCVSLIYLTSELADESRGQAVVKDQ